MRKISLILALVMIFTLCATFVSCNNDPGEQGTPSDIPGVEDGVLTVGMECMYAPYNWTQLDDSNGAEIGRAHV